MWTARARWKVSIGTLNSAVVLTQGSHADWEDIEGEEYSQESERMILGQPDQPAPCEITIDFPEASFFVSLIKVSSTARTCEVYSRKLGSQDHEYVCTIRGKEQKPPPTAPAFPTPPDSSDQESPPIAPAFPTPSETSPQEPPPTAPAVPTPPQTRHQETNPSSPAIATLAKPSSLEPPPEASAFSGPPKPSLDAPQESQEGQSNNGSNPDTKPHLLPLKKEPAGAPVAVYTCGIKLARGPALTSLRLKFVSLQNKAELQIDPIRIYASRGPTAAAPPRLTGNSLSALAPLLPALGPLFSSGVPGIPQLPGAFSHLFPPQQSASNEEARRSNGNGAEERSSSPAQADNGNVNKGAASGGHSHPAVPEGLAQLMASMQGLRAGRGHSHPAGVPQMDAAGGGGGSAQRPPMNLAALMAAIGNSRGVLPSGVTPGSSDEEASSRNAALSGAENREDSQSVTGTESRSEVTQHKKNESGGSANQGSTLEAILRRLEGLEGTCLRIERAVTGALSGFDARLRRLEERDAAREKGVNEVEGVSERRHRAEPLGVNGHSGTDERRVAGEVSITRGRFEDSEDSAMTDAVPNERGSLEDRPGRADGQAKVDASEATEFEGTDTEPVRSARRLAEGAEQVMKEEGLHRAPLEGAVAASEERGERITPETGAEVSETVPYEEAELTAVL